MYVTQKNRNLRTQTLLLPEVHSAAPICISRSTSPFPLSASMTFVSKSPRATPPPTSCHSSPGNSNVDGERSVLNITPFPLVINPLQMPSPPAHGDCDDWQLARKSKRHYVLLSKLNNLLQDNRALSSEHPNTARRLRQLNAEYREDKSCRVLKFILNAVFVVIGLLLLFAVIAAIAYTSNVSPDTEEEDLNILVRLWLNIKLSDYGQSPVGDMYTTDRATTSGETTSTTPASPLPFTISDETTLRRICKSVPIIISDNNIQLKDICFQVRKQ